MKLRLLLSIITFITGILLMTYGILTDKPLHIF